MSNKDPTPTPISYCVDTVTLSEIEGSGCHRLYGSIFIGNHVSTYDIIHGGKLEGKKKKEREREHQRCHCHLIGCPNAKEMFPMRCPN